jgi:hypothetical protein
VQWHTFRYGEDTYDLGHLHPKAITYVLEARGDKPVRAYAVEVHFSLHCFTCGIKPSQAPDPAMLYSDDREVRIFDAYRWQLSHYLPGIVEGLMGRKCFHTGYGNFLTVELVNQQDQTIVKYEVFFEVSRSTRRGVLTLFIQSAYVRESSDAGGKRRHNPPIRFSFILHNTINNIAIKVPRN